MFLLHRSRAEKMLFYVKCIAEKVSFYFTIYTKVDLGVVIGNLAYTSIIYSIRPWGTFVDLMLSVVSCPYRPSPLALVDNPTQNSQDLDLGIRAANSVRAV